MAEVSGISTVSAGGEVLLSRSEPDQVPADIGGQVREDRDADGDLSDPDPGLVGVIIKLYSDNNGDGS